MGQTKTHANIDSRSNEVYICFNISRILLVQGLIYLNLNTLTQRR